MARTADSFLKEFIEEANELLARLEERGLSSRTDSLTQRCEETELCLHTLKGNASAFGLSSLADAASAVLERVKAAREAEERAWLDGEGRKILGEFVDRARDCLHKANKKKRAPKGQFDGLLGRLDGRSRGGGRRQKGGEVVSAVEKDVSRILAGAPEVAPRIREIVALARRELERERAGITSGFCPDDEMVDGEEPVDERSQGGDVSPGTSVSGRQDAKAEAGGSARATENARKRVSAGETPAPGKAPFREPPEGSRPRPRSERTARGYAFEARRLRDELDALIESGSVEERDRATPLRLAEFLDAFVRGVEAHPPLASDVLDREGPGSRLLRDALGADPAIDAEDPGLRLPPALWDLLCGLMADACLAAGGRGEELREVHLRLERGETGWRLTAGGLPGVSRTARRLKVFPLRRWVEELGGALVERGGELAVELPDRFASLDVLRVRAGEADVGFPAHRVVGVVDFGSLSARPPQTVSANGARFVLFEGERVELVDLTGRGRPDEVEGGCAVIVQKGKALQAVKVDEVVDRSEMLVEACSEEEGGDGVLGFCIAEKQRSRFPLLTSALG